MAFRFILKLLNPIGKENLLIESFYPNIDFYFEILKLNFDSIKTKE